MTRPGNEPTSSRSRGGRLNHKATVAVYITDAVAHVFPWDYKAHTGLMLFLFHTWIRSTFDRGTWLGIQIRRFDPVASQCEGQTLCSSESTLVQNCLCLTPFVCTARTHICAHVKYPISTCRKGVGLAAGCMETRKHCTQEKNRKKNLGSTVLRLFPFPGESSPNFPCIALGQECYLNQI